MGWDVTPGVPAYAAAAAIIGRELTVPELAQTVILTRIQAVSTAMPETESMACLAAARATMIIHLAIRRIRLDLCRADTGVRRGLPGRGESGNATAAERNRSCAAPCATIADQVERCRACGKLL